MSDSFFSMEELKQKSVINFLIHRKSFWLSVLTMSFLVWAWNDSEHYRNFVFGCINHYYVDAQSRDGGVSFDVGYHSAFSTDFTVEREEKYPAIGPRKMICFAPPVLPYYILQMAVLLVSISWLTWRWRKMTKSDSPLLLEPQSDQD